VGRVGRSGTTESLLAARQATGASIEPKLSSGRPRAGVDRVADVPCDVGAEAGRYECADDPASKSATFKRRDASRIGCAFQG
jgi:hypothetical protein